MSDIYKLQYNGMTLAYPGWNGYVAMPPSYRTLTLQTDGHGTLTATTLTGLPGDTVTLTPTYNTYYRFSGYDCTGGSIEGNTFTFDEGDATAKANFRQNIFTAGGVWGNIQNNTTKKNGYCLGVDMITWPRLTSDNYVPDELKNHTRTCSLKWHQTGANSAIEFMAQSASQYNDIFIPSGDISGFKMYNDIYVRCMYTYAYRSYITGQYVVDSDIKVSSNTSNQYLHLTSNITDPGEIYWSAFGVGIQSNNYRADGLAMFYYDNKYNWTASGLAP